ncbi:phage regulatory CII family protein [Psychrobacter sp. AOP30-A2-5]|uniref:phage regulatory CII family protein n=1 Tax=Psychrobacter sp. AOP30-A2-5 TaxID=3457697 RepID=UPI004036AD23
MSKQKYTAAERAENCVLDLEAAVYQAAMKPRGTLGGICETFGLTYNTAVLQVNPKRTCHTLSPILIEQVLSATQSSLIMDAICCAHGSAGWFRLPDADNQCDDMFDIAMLGQKFADLNSTAIDAYADKVIEPDEYARMQKDGQALLRHIQTILENARINTQKNNDR